MEVRLVDLKAPVSAEDAAFVTECLVALFAPIAGRVDEMRMYLDAHVRPPETSVLVIEVDGHRAGIVTLVRFAMPRYLGYGYEIQELVVAPPHQNKGVARRTLALVAERCRGDARARKVVIRTNVDGARRAYASVWSATDLTSFQTMLNLLQSE
jgi:GNAT superfamily N-acetyltransferase